MKVSNDRGERQTIVELSSVEVRVGNHLIVSDTDLICRAGDVIALRGPNGSGKTSMLRTFAGLLKPRLGSRIGPKSCAYVPAAFDPPGIAAGLWLDSFPRRQRTGYDRVLELLEFRGDLSDGCDALSFGNLRKLVIAEAFSSGEPLVIIDEAGMGLDGPGIQGLRFLTREIAEAGACVIVSGQDSQFMPESDAVIVLRNQQLISVPVGQVEGKLHLVGDVVKLDQIRAVANRLGVDEVPS